MMKNYLKAIGIVLGVIGFVGAITAGLYAFCEWSVYHSAEATQILLTILVIVAALLVLGLMGYVVHEIKKSLDKNDAIKRSCNQTGTIRKGIMDRIRKRKERDDNQTCR
jgi:nitrate/nitrite transporter NarK